VKKVPTLVRRAREAQWRVSFLERLANFLNRSAPETDYWQKAETILNDWFLVEQVESELRPQLLQRAIDTFNSWAAKNPVRFHIRLGPNAAGVTDISATLDCKPGEQVAIEHLWSCFFSNPERHRLKRCPECRKWFADKTRNLSMVRCSMSCTNKWWTLERRQKAGHDVPGSTRRAKRRVTP
jgi:hypothetical protein